MHEKTTSVCGRCPQRKSAGVSLRAGIAKDKLIFIIICLAAIGVAVVTLAVTQFSGGRGGRVKSEWQCLSPECGHEFSSKTVELPPIECPKCSGEAVRMISRKCPACGEKNLISRMRLTKEGQTQLKAMKAQQGDRPMMPMMGPMGMGMSMEVQLWYEQDDGSYTWSEWMPMNQIMYRGQVCSKCGASLYGRR